MKIASKLMAVGLLFLGSVAYGSSDRFGNERAEIPRSSFTAGGEFNAFIASVTEPNVNFATMTPASGGSLVLRGAIFSGVIPSTITFFDGGIFDGNITTRTILNYSPGGSGIPTRVDLDMFISTGIGYSKVGLAPVTILWDWLSPRKTGDKRP